MVNGPSSPPAPHRIEQLRDVCTQLSGVVAALTTVEQEDVRAALRERVTGYRARLAGLGITPGLAERIFADNPRYYMDHELYAETMASRLLDVTADDIPSCRQFRGYVGEHTAGKVRFDTLADVLQPAFDVPATPQLVISRYRRVVGVLTMTAISLGALNGVRGPLALETEGGDATVVT